MIFISYRHESDEHKLAVKNLATELKAKGVEVVLDQDVIAGPDETWTVWCGRQLEMADKVIIVLSAGWLRCFESKEDGPGGLGAGQEARTIREHLIELRGKAAKYRMVTVATSGSFEMPTEIRSSHRLHIEREGGFEGLLAWLSPPAPPLAAPPAAAPAWPAIPHDDKWPFADATHIRDAFTELLKADAAYRVLLIRGNSETGKTSISKYLLSRVTRLTGLASGRLDLKGSTGLDQELKRFAVHLVAEDETVDDILGGGDTVDRLQRLVAHLKQQAKPALLVIDSYDEAQEREYSNWIESLILATLRFDFLRVVISGQKVHSNWASLAHGVAQFIQLRPPNIEDWQECARVHRPRFSKEFVEILFEQVEGSPAAIAGIFKLDTPPA